MRSKTSQSNYSSKKVCEEPIRQAIETPKPIIYFNTKPLDSLKDQNSEPNLLALLKADAIRYNKSQELKRRSRAHDDVNEYSNMKYQTNQQTIGSQSRKHSMNQTYTDMLSKRQEDSIQSSSPSRYNTDLNKLSYRDDEILTK